MSRNVRVAVLGLFLLVPAVVLVSTGLLSLDRPDVLVHPAFVMGGLLFAFALNAFPVFRFRLSYEQGSLVGAMFLQLRGAVLNLATLALACLLLVTIVLYLFVENFQPR